MQNFNFDILKKNQNLGNVYICYGSFVLIKDELKNLLLEKYSINIDNPGHYIFQEDSFLVKDARNLKEWYFSGKTSNDDKKTVVILAPGNMRADAQQMLLKILEDTKENYVFFIILPHGAFVLDTVLSRSQSVFYLYSNDEIASFEKIMKLPLKEKISEIKTETKNLTASGVRVYIDNLLNKIIFYLNNEPQKDYEKLKKIMKIKESLTDGRVAPKFILDYITTIL